MARIGRSIRWYFIFTLLFTLMVGGGVIWFWMRSDELLKGQLTSQLNLMVPDWNVQIGRTRYDWKSQIHIFDVTIQGDNPGRPLLQLPEVIVKIDVEQFKANQHLQVQKLILKRPTLNLMRNVAGEWNWARLSPPPRTEEPVPEIEIRDARYKVVLENGNGRPPGEVFIEQANVKLVPTGKRNVSIEGLTHINQLGRLAIKGNWSVDTGQWDVKGSIEEVKTQGEFLSLIAGQSPELLTKLQRLDSFLKNYPAQQQEVIAKTAATTGGPVPEAELNSVVSEMVPDFGVKVLFDLDFEVNQTVAGAEPDFQFKLHFKDGLITNRVLPFPLSDLKGDVVWKNDQINIEKVTALNGPAGIQATGLIGRQPDKASFDLDLKFRNITLDQELRARLTPGLGKLYDDFNPAGLFDLDVEFYYRPETGLKYRNLLAKVRAGSCRFIKFPYPFTAIEGTVQQPGDSDVMQVELTGLAARCKTSINGWLKNPGREAESHFDIAVSNLPIDENFLSSCPPPLKATLNALQIQGRIDAQVELYRPAGFDQKYHQKIDVDLHHAAIQYEHFPYPVNDLTGVVHYDNQEKIWYFSELQGRNGQTQLRGEGRFDATREPGELSLAIDAQEGYFDSQLKQALTPQLQTIWDQMSPRGKLDLSAVIHWVKGTPAADSIAEAACYSG
ncbi:MAG: hypothetical protein R3C11_06125 [Planctomycetaceae bacterium]